MDESNLLHVSGLTRNVTEAHLEEIFACFGELASVSLAVDETVGLSKGYAIVEFAARGGARAALDSLDGGVIDGAGVAVRVVTPERDRSPSRSSRRCRCRRRCGWRR